jgi:capsular polysaccharide biosynthesis protein
MNSADAAVLSQKMLDHYLPDSPRAGCGKSKEPVIAVLNREKARRRLTNNEEVVAALEAAGFQILYKPNFNNMTLVDQIQFMSQADIVIGPHGAQFTNSVYQPQCGSLVELFGHGYYLPNFFGSLVRLSGKYHFVYYAGGKTAPRKYRTTKEYSVLPEVVVPLVQRAVEKWHECCEHGFQ